MTTQQTDKLYWCYTTLTHSWRAFSRSSLLVVAAMLPATIAAADSIPVLMDGRFADWDGREKVLPAQSDLVESAQIALGENDIFIAIKLKREVNIQQDNPLTLLADTDGNAATGMRVGAMGVDVQYNFGTLRAIRHRDDAAVDVSQAEIGITWAPTFSSDRYEISLPRKLFGNPGADQSMTVAIGELPNLDGTATMLSHKASPPATTPGRITLDRLPAGHVRILTMNVLYDGLFKKPDTYARILNALDPDILLLSEVFSHSSDQVIALLDKHFPAKNPEQRWYGFGRPGKVTISRYPFLATDVLLDDLYTVIDAPGFNDGLFVIHTHLECCDNDPLRQQKANDIVETMARLRQDKYSILYRYDELPLVFSGDLNLVGDRGPYTRLVNGIAADLMAATAAGEQAKQFVEAISLHTDSPFTFTWKDDALKWPPGKLDFTFLTTPDIVLGKSFVLYTPEMDPADLERHGLQASDSVDASDHLPHIIDIAPGKIGVDSR